VAFAPYVTEQRFPNLPASRLCWWRPTFIFTSAGVKTPRSKPVPSTLGKSTASAMFVFGLASMFYPPLRLLIGSVTTSAAIAVGGLALIVLPTLIVGNELLILGGVGLAVGGWFLAHRHGRLQGFVEANKNGVDDRVEG